MDPSREDLTNIRNALLGQDKESLARKASQHRDDMLALFNIASTTLLVALTWVTYHLVLDIADHNVLSAILDAVVMVLLFRWTYNTMARGGRYVTKRVKR